MSRSAASNRSHLWGVGFLAAWIALIAVVATTAHGTQVLIEEQNDVLALERDLIQEGYALQQTNLTAVCGSWLGTFQVLNVWLATPDAGLSPKAATKVRERFAVDFKQHCPDYEQTFP